MPIMFNTILEGLDLTPEKVRLLRHQDTREGYLRTPFEFWLYERPTFEVYQAHQNPTHRSRFGDATRWASFVGLPTENQTMFVGLYRVVSRQTTDKDTRVPYKTEIEKAGVDVYELELDERMKEFDGKLFVDWGSGMRTWIQRADSQNKPITELRRQFKEPDFPGFLHFVKSLSEILSLPTGWIDILRNARGIYLLTCPKTKEQYVGSADGVDGFYGRWCEYAKTGHGGDIALKSREPSDYRISILEVAGTSATHDDVLAMEQLWKSKLQSRDMGLNRN
jgi:hypothetical protein